MKFAPVTLAVAAALAASSVAPAFAQDYRDRDQYRDDRGEYRGDVQYRNYDDYCRHQKHKGQRDGAAIGAIAGALLGSSVAAHHGNRTGGALLGAAAGAAVGANVGRDASKGKCDRSGYAYWGYEDTYPYDDRTYYHGGGRYDDRWYHEHRCRWARDYDGSYVRVCPDRNGYYRSETYRSY